MICLTRVSAVVLTVLALVALAQAQTVADPERFKRAIDEYVARTSVNLGRPSTARGADESSRVVRKAALPGATTVVVVAEGDFAPRRVGSHKIGRAQVSTPAT